MKKNKVLGIGMIFVLAIILVSFVSAYTRSTPQFTQYGNVGGFGFEQSSLEFDTSMCEAGQDFVIQIVPFGCTPAVVRSDLLEEQNVPVFCQLGATKINPLIDVEAIESISFQGEYPDEIAGIGFQPAKAALGVSGNLNSPVLNNIGYAVIVLKQQEDVSKVPEFVSGTLTANIKYDIKNAFGIGKTQLYLPQLSDSDWDEQKLQYGFWNGKGYLRADDIGINAARISLYDGTNKLRSVSLEEGKTSEKITLPGFDCLATLQLRLNDLVNPTERVKLKVGEDLIEVAVGEKFLEDKCYVKEISKAGLKEKVTISCREDESSGIFSLGYKTFTLMSAPKIKFKIGEEEKEISLGELLYSFKKGGETRGVYLAYVGSVKGAKDTKVLLLSKPTLQGGLTDSDLRYAHNLMQLYNPETDKGEGLGLFLLKGTANMMRGISTNIYGSIFQGVKTKIISLGGEIIGDENFDSKEIKFVDFASPINEDFESSNFIQVSNNYNKAKQDYETIINNFANEKINNISYGEQALIDYIRLANDLKQKATVAELCEKFKTDYSKSKQLKQINNGFCDKNKLANTEASSSFAYVNGRLRRIALEGIYEPTKEEYSADILIRGPNGKSETINFRKNEVYYLDSFRFTKNSEIEVGGNLYVRYSTLSNEWQWKQGAGGANTIWTNIDSSEIKRYKNTVTQEQEQFLYALNVRDFQEGLRLISNYKGVESIELLDLEVDYAKFRVSVSKGGLKSVKDFLISDSETFELNKAKVLGDYSFVLTKPYLKKTAKVSVIPGIENVGSETTFDFKIGIEQRSIELSPEKTKEIISNLDESIAEWEERSEDLGKVVKTMKTACLGVGAALTVKNFFSNLGGKAIARQSVMRGEGGWTEYCKQKVGEGTYKSLSACYDANSQKIDDDVKVLSGIISKQNSRIKDDKKGTYVKDGLGSEVVDRNKYMENSITSVKSGLTSNTNYYEKDGNRILMDKYLDYNAFKEQGTISESELREIEQNSLILESDTSPEIEEAARKRLNSVYAKVYDSSQAYFSQQQAQDTLQSPQVDIFSSAKLKDVRYTKDITLGDVKSITSNRYPDGYNANTKVRTLRDATDNKDYLVVIDDKGVVEKTYSIESDGRLTGLGTNPKKLRFQKIDASAYNNPWKGIPELRYFETEPYKGLPETVPVDVKKGWYASIRQTLPVGGQISAYDESGRVRSFYLCNIGANQLEENRGGDDDCTLINTGTRQPYNQIAGLTETESKRLIDNAIKAIEQGSRAYKSGISGQIRVLGQVVRVGAPAANVPALQCEDVMSPKDCKILFNVCDPVICPSSRCNFGGTYAVRDVVQSGIIGSLVLCLPNFPQVIIPVCLTGIKAGIDGWLSVLTSYRDCMQDSLETGKMTGICDEIYSIHSCEFFWRQALPLAKLGIPKLVSALAGQGTKGGGEYLTVQSAWDNAQQSVNYFTQYYAANSFSAFNARSTEQVGTEVCNAFISGVYPSGDFIDKFTEPDSPAQFHGRFDEIPFTTATNPPISQYKVYYHIYAGKDTGAYYKVYLKGSSESSYYQDVSATRLLVQDYVKLGEYATDTLDFTAPSGYSELCINVGGKEECGFKQVSTSFAVDYVNEQYIKEQSTLTNIKTESECVSGSASAYSLLSPSLESGAGEIANPAVYKRGIIRVCASKNPGLSTDALVGTNASRWREVGYCGDSNIKCWLDTDSVKDIVHSTTTEGQILSELNENSLKLLKESGQLLDGESFSAKIKEIEKQKDISKRIELINDAFNRVFYNNQKARLLLLRAEAYGNLAKISYKNLEKSRADSKKTKEGEEKWTVLSALEEVALLSGGYSDNRDFVEDLFEDGVISREEFNKLKEEGEDMDYLESVLIDKLKENEEKYSGENPKKLSVADVKISELNVGDKIITSAGEFIVSSIQRKGNVIILYYVDKDNQEKILMSSKELDKNLYELQVDRVVFSSGKIISKLGTSFKIPLYFDYGKNDKVEFYWDFDENLAKADIYPNDEERVYEGIIYGFSSNSEMKEKMYVEDLNIVNIVLSSNSPAILSQSIKRVLLSKRASIDNDGKYDVALRIINLRLYGEETSPSREDIASGKISYFSTLNEF